MDITVDQVKDYLFCPKYFKLCHIDALKKPRDINIKIHYREAILRTMYHFFYNVQEGTIISLKEIRKKFGDLYVGRRKVHEALGLNRASSYVASTYERKSVPMIHNFHEKYSKEHGTPIFVDRSFDIKLGNNTLLGNIPIIRENDDKEIELLTFHIDTSLYQRNTLDMMAKFDLDITASLLASKAILKRDIDCLCFGLFSGREITVDRSQNDYLSLKLTVTNVFNSTYCIHLVYDSSLNSLMSVNISLCYKKKVIGASTYSQESYFTQKLDKTPLNIIKP